VSPLSYTQGGVTWGSCSVGWLIPPPCGPNLTSLVTRRILLTCREGDRLVFKFFGLNPPRRVGLKRRRIPRCVYNVFGSPPPLHLIDINVARQYYHPLGLGSSWVNFDRDYNLLLLPFAIHSCVFSCSFRTGCSEDAGRSLIKAKVRRSGVVQVTLSCLEFAYVGTPTHYSSTVSSRSVSYLI
jgi:hypothetical protein